MSDATKRDAVVEEFCPQRYRESPWQTIRKLAAEDMADEIVRLRDENAALRAAVERAERILAALREPSNAVVLAADKKIPILYRLRDTKAGIIAAVAAAEQEVGRE